MKKSLSNGEKRYISPLIGPIFKGYIFNRKILLKGVKKLVQVAVKFNNVDHALKILKKKIQREGIFRILRNCRYYRKPSEKRAQKEDDARRRRNKLTKKVYASDY